MPLRPHFRFKPIEGPVLVVVMDGIGLGPQDEGNAVFLARTPTLDFLMEQMPWIRLQAHGKAVGLPSDEDMGNSEVGHNAIGAGRIFDQGAKLVNRAIESGAIFQSEAWRKAIQKVKSSGEPLHFIGLLSDGNVHSHQAHLEALIERAHLEGVQRIRVHALLDGRDVPETSALIYVDRLEHFLDRFRSLGRDYWVASGGGRMRITMDRYEADWGMVERGWKVHVQAEGRRFRSLREAIETLRAEEPGIIDQNLPGFVITDEKGEPRGPIRDGAAVIFFNFRGDRAIEITRAFEEEHFTKFARGPRPAVFYAGMMQYDGDLKLPTHYLVAPPAIDRSLSELLSESGVLQFACSETQKFGHVTYFWNGNCSQPFEGEDWVEVPSDNRPFEERPWMKAAEITDTTIEALRSQRYRFARINYANGDMVGHTGVLRSAILGVEAVDLSLSRLLPVIAELRGAALITADHGNADEMFERDRKTGAFLRTADGKMRPKTSHTLNPVPFILYAPGRDDLRLRHDLSQPGLANIASTVL
ncbi:MAG: 2,3-bisphosphoglycerate-independent phosphoglycerate mutase, partial [Deltaproteobacteria bacterium]|nr:2,3-bisphosphoglycerate-independent phosphoglycerate mutase [Deltaproteobacteria bacterium]